MRANGLRDTLVRGLYTFGGLVLSVAVLALILILCLAGWGRLMDATDELGMDPARSRYYRAGEELPPPNLSAFALEERLVTNCLGMKLALIPPGEFIMGSPSAESGRGEDELPHRVQITQPFYLAVHEVTVGQFRRFVTETGHKPFRENYPPAGPHDDRWERHYRLAGAEIASWDSPGLSQRDDHPVVNVSWTDTEAFLRWLSEKDYHTYRLPTEAEWEYACRAGTTQPYGVAASGAAFANVGEMDPDPDRRKSPWQDGFEYTAPVGSFPPNRLGLFDMHGNVWEQCADYYKDSYYEECPACDPRCLEPGECRVMRGGGWSDPLYYARSANRAHWFESKGSPALGFRVARENTRQ